MAVRPLDFYRGALPNALTTLFTYSSKKGADVLGFVEVVNGSDQEATVNVYLVPNGSAAGDGFAKLNGVKVAPHSSTHIAGWWPFSATGDVLQASSVGTRLAIDASGIRRT